MPQSFARVTLHGAQRNGQGASNYVRRAVKQGILRSVGAPLRGRTNRCSLARQGSPSEPAAKYYVLLIIARAGKPFRASTPSPSGVFSRVTLRHAARDHAGES